MMYNLSLEQVEEMIDAQESCGTISDVDIELLSYYVDLVEAIEMKSRKHFSDKEINNYRYLKLACDCLNSSFDY